MIKVVDKSKNGVYSSNMELVDSFTDYSSKNLDFDKPVTIELLDDEENAKNPLGMTAYYSPEEMKIVVYVTGRHLKDILRSISHELIHHVQNCRGDLDHTDDTKLGYAQRDSHMRNMETEAYNSGNIMNFRDFEDIYKQGKHKMSKLKENRLKKLNGLLMEQPSKELIQYTDPNDNSEYTQLVRQKIALGTYGYTPKKGEKFPAPDDNTPEAQLKRREVALAGQRPSKALIQYTDPEDNSRLAQLVRRKIALGTYPYKPVTGEKFPAPNDNSREAQLRRRQVALGSNRRKDKMTASPAGSARGKGSGKRRIKYKTCRKLPLRLGCKGDMVMVLQSLLYNALKLKTSRKKFIDSHYGPATKSAVESFQRKAKIAVDGVAGKDTFDALRKTQPKKAVAGLDKRVDEPTATASPAGPDAPPAARPTRMTRVEAMRRAKEDIVPKLRRVRTRSYKRGLVRYLMIGLRELLDVQKMDPAKAYRTLLNIFGQGGAKYISPNYRSQSLMPDEQRAKMSDAWKRNYENALNKTLEEL